MPALTLKNIQRTGELGTEATRVAGTLFDRAFNDLTSAAQTVQQGRKDAVTAKGIENTEALKQQILSARTPDQLASLPGIIDQAKADAGGNVNTAVINELARNQEQNAFNLNKQAIARNLDPQLTNLANQIGVAGADQVGGITNELTGLTDSGVDITPLTSALETRKSTIAAGNERDKTLAIEAAANNPALAQVQPKPGATINDTIASVRGVQGLMTGLPVSQQREATRNALGKLGVTPDAIFAQFYNQQDGTGKAIGISDPARLTKLLDDNLPGMFTAKDITELTASRHNADGTRSKKAAVAKEQDRQNKLTDQIKLATAKNDLKIDSPTYAVDLVNKVIDVDSSWNLTDSDQAAALVDIGIAKASGNYTSDQIFSALLKSVENKDYTAGAITDALKPVKTSNNVNSTIRRVQEIQRQLDQLPK